MMTEPLGEKVKFCDRSQSPQHGLEAYWAGLLERVKRERNHLFKGKAPLKGLPPRRERREEN